MEILKNKYALAVIAIAIVVAAFAVMNFMGGQGGTVGAGANASRNIETTTATEGSTVKKSDIKVDGNVGGGISQ